MIYMVNLFNIYIYFIKIELNINYYIYNNLYALY